MRTRSAQQVAQYILGQAMGSGELVTNLKMQKLVYYAYAHALVLTGTPLFSDEIKAWKLGPVAPNLYHELKVYGYNPIGVGFLHPYTPETAEIELESLFNFEQLFAMDLVCDHYMSLGARALSNKSHEEPPWNRGRERPDESITDDDIRDFFAPKAQFPTPPITGVELRDAILSDKQFVNDGIRGLEEVESGRFHNGKVVMQEYANRHNVGILL